MTNVTRIQKNERQGVALKKSKTWEIPTEHRGGES